MMMRLTIMMWMLTRPTNGVTGRIEHLSFQVTSGFGNHGPTLVKKGLHLHMDGIALSSNLSGLPTPISAHFLLQCPLALNHLCPQSYSHSDVLCPVQWPPGC